MAVIQNEQGINKPIMTDTSHVFDVNGNPLHGELFIGETIASDDVEEIDGFAHESDVNAINQDLAELKLFTFGTQIDITSYNTSNNQYTCPSDGYVYCMSGANAKDLIGSYVDGILLCYAETVQTGGYNQIDSVYVRKGMTIYTSVNSGNRGKVYFVPIQAAS